MDSFLRYCGTMPYAFIWTVRLD